MTRMTAAFNAGTAHADQYRGKSVVIKFGGALAENDDVIRNIARQAAFLTTEMGARVVVVHGGGKQINQALEDKGITPRRDPATDLRITDAATLDVSDAALRTLNGRITRLFQDVADVQAMGMAGYDARVVQSQPLNHFTGEAVGVDAGLLDHLTGFAGRHVVPVIYPICHSLSPVDGEARLNVNADDVAAAIAAAMKAERLVLCSDIPGVLDKNKILLPDLTIEDIDALIADNTVTGGMIAKVKAAAQAAQALDKGGVVILDGRKENVILNEFLLESGAGTLIRHRLAPKP